MVLLFHSLCECIITIYKIQKLDLIIIIMWHVYIAIATRVFSIRGELMYKKQTLYSRLEPNMPA